MLRYHKISNIKQNQVANIKSKTKEKHMLIKRIMSFSSAFVLSIASLLVLYVPSASAATLTWTGGGADSNFSTADNWDLATAPENGDSIVFDYEEVEDTLMLNNDIENLELSSIEVVNATEEFFDVEITGEDFSLSSGISAEETLILDVNVDMVDDQSVVGTVRFLADLDVDTYTIDFSLMPGNDWSSPRVSNLTGAGSVSVNQEDTTLTVSSSTGFSGDISAADSAQLLFNAENASNDATIDIAEGSFLTLCGQDYTYGGDVAVGGSGSHGTGISFTLGCLAGGGGGGAPPSSDVTLDGTVELTADTTAYVPLNTTVSINDINKNGFELTLTESSEGTLTIGGDAIENEPKTITIDDDEPETSVTVRSFETVILTGARGFISVNGILKGTGTASSINVNSTGTLAPGLSPGCMETESLFFDGGTYEVEIVGNAPCDEYDQMQVSDSVDLTNDPTLDVSFLDNFVPELDDEFVIILNEGEDEVAGNFSGLEEGASFEVSGVTFEITYESGEGENDVVLTVLEVDPDAVPEAPDTGFALLLANPIVALLGTLAAAGALTVIARKQLALQK